MAQHGINAPAERAAVFILAHVVVGARLDGFEHLTGQTTHVGDVTVRVVDCNKITSCQVRHIFIKKIVLILQ